MKQITSTITPTLPAAQVLRVVIFKRISLLAMVEFSTVEAAAAARTALHGCNIYPNMCTIRTEFTDKETLNVNENSIHDRWDFEKSGPPDGVFGRGGGGGGAFDQLMPRTTRKYLLDFPSARPWKDKTESPDKIQQELSRASFLLKGSVFGTDPDRNRVTWETPSSEAISFRRKPLRCTRLLRDPTQTQV
jgi:hypothetical protein